MKQRSKKHLYVILTILVIAVICFAGFLYYFESHPDHDWSSTIKNTSVIEKTDGVIKEASHTTLRFPIQKSGDYTLELSWLPEGTSKEDVGKLTSRDVACGTLITLKDANGTVVYATAVTSVSLDTKLELGASEYVMDFTYFTDREQYVELAKEYLCGASMVQDWADLFDFNFGNNGTYNMSYDITLSPAGEINISRTTGMALGLLIGFCLVFVMLIAITKSHQLESPKYDERQDLERGRGYCYAFFTTMIFIMLVYCLDSCGLIAHGTSSFLYVCAAFLGITVYAIYCIFHESYFALNQKTGTVLVMFALIMLINLFVSIMNFREGELFKDGQFTYNMLNPLCCLTFFALFVAVVVKTMIDKRGGKGDESGDEDEEE
ncbi:MAG: hypothetical protein II743_00635 [Lachnospiraceae bacterium]|nr:hypothetical protein [Lachnospiraceae bacterium]